MDLTPRRPERIVVLGGGGHARVVVEALLLSGWSREALVILDPGLKGRELFGVPVPGGDELLSTFQGDNAVGFTIGLGGVGDNSPRRRLFELALSRGLKAVQVRHPSAVVSKLARTGPGSQFMAGVVVQPGAEVGANVIVNTGAIVEHDCVVGDHVHLATGATLSGGVRIGTLAHVGTGAVVRQGIEIGPGALIGAGAVVVHDIPAEAIVAGVPARPLAR